MKRSEAIKQFKIKVAEDLVYRHAWSICEDEDVPSLHDGSALYEAIDKNLHLITDIGAHLPYEVYDCDDELVGAFPHERFAEAFVGDVDWHDDRMPLEIVGPGERGGATDDGVPAPPAGYRIVGRGKPQPGDMVIGILGHATRPREFDRPRWIIERIPAPDYDPADVAFSDKAREAVGKIAGKLSGTDEPVSNPYKLPRLVAPAPQRTVKDLRPGEVVILDGRWSICTKAFALVDLLDGAARNPRSDTTIDKVYRFEVTE